MAATPGQLFERVATTFAMPLVQVKQMDRFLADAGLRTMTGGRGRNAPKVTSRDAAHLLIAASASRNIKDAADIAYSFGQLPLSPNQETLPEGQGLTLPAIDSLAPDHVFADALAALIDTVRSGEFEAAIRAKNEADSKKLRALMVRVELFQPFEMARIEVYNGPRCLSLQYNRHPDYQRSGSIEIVQSRNTQKTDLQHISTFGLKSIGTIADLLGPKVDA